MWGAQTGGKTAVVVHMCDVSLPCQGAFGTANSSGEPVILCMVRRFCYCVVRRVTGCSEALPGRAEAEAEAKRGECRQALLYLAALLYCIWGKASALLASICQGVVHKDVLHLVFSRMYAHTVCIYIYICVYVCR